MKKNIFAVTGAFIFLFAAGCDQGSFSKEPIPGAAEYLGNDHWNKGNAEYQVYHLSDLPWYGKPRKSDGNIMLAVKEPWNSKHNVKGNADTMDSTVLKFSIFKQFMTGTYPYSFKADFFFHVKTGEVIKYTMGSQDGCGNNFLRYDKEGKNGHFVWHSYWDNHGLIDIKKPVTEFDTFMDALPMYLRFRLKENSYTAKAVQPIIANRPIDIKQPKPHIADQTDAVKRGVPHIVEIKVTNTPGEVDGKKVIKSEVVHGDKTDVFVFEEAFPHTMVAWHGAANWKLRLSKFFPYWKPENRGKEAGYLLK
ncbi:MAG: hypothetical protein OEZ34_07990 [Spirochaetia bacterium]|nr:hypothetical protein [Spirochaetia bacterium]